VIRLPAIADAEDDPLGRAIGEPLWADDTYGYGAGLIDIRDRYERDGNARDWYALYQGLPRPPAGSIFLPDEMPVHDDLPGSVVEVVRGWDLASSVDGDWTVGIRLAHCTDRSDQSHYVITDVVRMRGTPEKVRRLVLDVAEGDGYGTKVALPQDPGQAGSDQALSYTTMLAGRPVVTPKMTGSKVTRAEPVAAQANIRRVGMLRAPWNRALIEELASFPSGVHDDQVDALAIAFNSMLPVDLSIWLRM
jgi:predicted phage terminase large subunit-like protein